MTKIEWTNETINPIIGCSKISPGCQNCYAERMARRLAAIPKMHENYSKVLQYEKDYEEDLYFPTKWNGQTAFVESALQKPFTWKKPRMVFVCSMSDLFHESVSWSHITEVMRVIEKCPQHIFQVLTKRPERMKIYFDQVWQNYDWNPLNNLWLGVTAENQEQADKRIPVLLQIPAAIRFVSVEPMLEEIDLTKYLSNEKQKHGIIGLPFHHKQRIGDRQVRESMENCTTQMEPLATENHIITVQEKNGSAPTPNGIPTTEDVDKQQEIPHISSPLGLVSFQRGDSGKYDNQSQEWGEGRQQARELGVVDAQRQQYSCNKDTEKREGCESRGVKQQHGQINEEASGSYKIINSFNSERGESSRENNELAGSEISSELRYDMEGSERNITQIHLIIAGKETGPSARPCKKEWIESLYSQCKSAGVPFFDKKDVLGMGIKEFPKL